jgi:RNA polymerase sigma-32 factor
MDQSLVTENVGLAHKIALAYHADADGHAAALLGLCEAADRFDPARGVKFSTYATWWVRCKVLKHKVDNERLVKIANSDYDRKLYFRLRREQADLAAQGLDAGVEVISERLDVPEIATKRMIGRLASPEVSLDRAYDMSDGQGRTLHDCLPSTDPTPDVLTEDKHDQDQMIKTMIEFEQGLDAIDLVIWNYRIASEDPLTLDATAQKVSEIKPMTRQAIYLREIKIRARFEVFAKDRIE